MKHFRKPKPFSYYIIALFSPFIKVPASTLPFHLPPLWREAHAILERAIAVQDLVPLDSLTSVNEPRFDVQMFRNHRRFPQKARMLEPLMLEPQFSGFLLHLLGEL